MNRRRVDSATLAEWFSFNPVAHALDEASGVPAARWTGGEPAPRYVAEPTA
jgi:hypothetical protein